MTRSIPPDLRQVIADQPRHAGRMAFISPDLRRRVGFGQSLMLRRRPIGKSRIHALADPNPFACRTGAAVDFLLRRIRIGNPSTPSPPICKNRARCPSQKSGESQASEHAHLPGERPARRRRGWAQATIAGGVNLGGGIRAGAVSPLCDFSPLSVSATRYGSRWQESLSATAPGRELCSFA